MEVSPIISNWKLSRSDDNVYWEVVHIATDQTNWIADEPRRFELGSDIEYLPIEKITFRGRVAIYGWITSNLTLSSQIKIYTEGKGFISIHGLDIQSFLLVGTTGIFCKGTFDRNLLSLIPNIKGYMSVGGHFKSTEVRLKSTIKGRTWLGGHLRNTLLTLQFQIRMATRMSIFAGLSLVFARNQCVFVGGITSSGGFNSNLLPLTAHVQGSNTRLYFTASIPGLISNFSARVKIGGSVSSTLSENTSTQIFGLVPLRLYILFHPTLDTVKFYLSVLSPNVGELNGILFQPTSKRTFAVTYVGVFVSATKGVEGPIWVKSGPPIRIPVNFQTLGPFGNIFGRTTIRGTVNQTLLSTEFAAFITTPIAIFGDFVTALYHDSGNIKIKNWRWFKAESTNLIFANTISSFKGFSWIAGRINPTPQGMAQTNVYGLIHLVVPIVVKGIWYKTLAPVYSGTIFGRAPIYGKCVTSFGNDQVRILGNQNVGKLNGELQLSTVRFLLLTIIHARGVLSNNVGNHAAPFPVQVKMYGRIANRGSVVGLLGNTLSIQIIAHTLIIPQPVFGAFITPLSSLIPIISLRMRLIYGTLTNVLGFKVLFKGTSLCYGALNDTLYSFNFKFEFDFHHFAGTFRTSTAWPKGDVLAHSRVLTQLLLKLSNLQSKITVDTSPKYHGRMDLDIAAYQDSYIIAYNGGVFSDIRLVFKRLLYGKLIASTYSIQFTDIYGKVPWNIHGIFKKETGDIYTLIQGKQPAMGRLLLSTAPDSFKRSEFFGRTNIGYFNASLVGLDPYRSVFKGSAAHAIIGVLQLKFYDFAINSPTGFIQPLRVQVRGRVQIYGQLLAPLLPFTYVVFRSENQIIGRWVGGDTRPTIRGYPYPEPNVYELEERIGKPIDHNNPPKIYWTTGWAYGNIFAFHKFPIIGYLYSGLSGKIAWQGYKRIVDSQFTETVVDIRGQMEIYITIDAWVHSFLEWETGFICYALFKGFTIKGPWVSKLKDLWSTIELNVIGGKIGRLIADFKPCVGNIGGFTTLKGGIDGRLSPATSMFYAKIPIHIKVNFTPVLEPLTPQLELYKPFQLYGVLINQFLDPLTVYGNFRGRATIYGKGLGTLNDDKEMTVIAKIVHVLGMINPTSRLARIYINFIGIVPNPNDYPGFTHAWFLAKNPTVVHGNIRLLAQIYQNLALNLQNTTTNIQLRTPIRIYGRWQTHLDNVTSSFPITVWSAGYFVKTLQALTTDFTSIYRVPIIVNLTQIIEDFIPTVYGTVLLYGTFNKALVAASSIFTTYHCAFGSLASNTVNFTSLFQGNTYSSTLDLPFEPNYTVGGRVDNTINSNRSYRTVLYDRNTTELVQKMSSEFKTPFDYSFGGVIFGRYFVLCSPSQAQVGSQVKTVIVDNEDNRYE